MILKGHFVAMSQSPKTYSLLLILVTFSFTLFGQELDSLKTSKKVLDRLELETSLSLLESQEFKSIPGAGVHIGIYAPFFNGGLRLGLGVGFSKIRYRYDFYTRYSGPSGYSDGYNSNLDMYPLNLDLTVGTDFLRKSDVDLILDVGARMYVPLFASYNFNYSVYHTYPEDHSFELASTILPSVLGQLSVNIPLGEKSSLSIRYGFSYIFNKFRPKDNSTSNGVYYQSDIISDNVNGLTEDCLVAVITEAGLQYLDWWKLELPSNIGGQHSFSIGYCYSFGLGKKTE
jgi:hypothetical protein